MSRVETHVSASPANLDNPSPLSLEVVFDRAELLSRRAFWMTQSIEADIEVLRAAREQIEEKRRDGQHGDDVFDITLETDNVAGAYGVKSTEKGLLFVQPRNDERVLCVGGDFNGWQPEMHPMPYDAALHAWRLCINLPAGRYRYRLVADGQWRHDVYNRYVEANPYGQLNNVAEHGMDVE